jgi:hypothetical protein
LVKSFRGHKFFAFYMLLMSYFSAVDAKGGEVLGSKATKNISNTKYHKIKIFILQVVLVPQVFLV